MMRPRSAASIWPSAEAAATMARRKKGCRPPFARRDGTANGHVEGHGRCGPARPGSVLAAGKPVSPQERRPRSPSLRPCREAACLPSSSAKQAGPPITASPPSLARLARDAAPGRTCRKGGPPTRSPRLGRSPILLHDPFRRLQKLFGRLPGDLPHRAGHLRPERSAGAPPCCDGPGAVPDGAPPRQVDRSGQLRRQSIEQSLRVEHRDFSSRAGSSWPPAQRGLHGLVQRFSAAASGEARDGLEVALRNSRGREQPRCRRRRARWEARDRSARSRYRCRRSGRRSGSAGAPRRT